MKIHFIRISSFFFFVHLIYFFKRRKFFVFFGEEMRGGEGRGGEIVELS